MEEKHSQSEYTRPIISCTILLSLLLFVIVIVVVLVIGVVSSVSFIVHTHLGTSIFEKGYTYPSFDDLVLAVTKFCDMNSCDYKITKRNKVQITITCPLPTCSFVIRARTNKVGDVKITSRDMNHSCHGNKKRQRNIKRKVLTSTNTMISSFVPTTVSNLTPFSIYFIS